MLGYVHMDYETIKVHGNEHTVIVRTAKGPITSGQEVFCWRYALHGNGMKAYRESFGVTMSTNAINVNACRLLRSPKILARIKRLIFLHNKKEINLKTGPWEHYGDVLWGVGTINLGDYPPRACNVNIARVLTHQEPNSA